MTDRDDADRGEDTEGSPRGDANSDEYGYDPFIYVPERIDQVTASGLVHLYDALHAANRAKLRSLPIERQGALLWALVEKGVVDVDLTIGKSQ